jgi:hypothetical protein
MRQAIITKYKGLTYSRGSRVQAKCAAKTRYFEWDCALNADENHERAARQLFTEMEWGDPACLRGGAMPDGSGYCFVAVFEERTATAEQCEAVRILVEHAEEVYPHFESERGQRDIARARELFGLKAKESAA